MSLPHHETKRLRRVAADEAQFESLAARRLAGEPLQYLEGTAPFGPWDLHVDHRVLIPRPETELLWEIATALVDAPKVIVDLCTGSGALALALAKSFPEARVLGTDLSVDALDVARANGDLLEATVDWCCGDLFEALPEDLFGTVDLLVSNPPYVAECQYAALPEDVRREPKLALVSGQTGLEAYERIAAEIGRWLAPGGRFALEIGETQAGAVRRLFAEFSPKVRQDLNRRDRYLIGSKS
ncbi:MAG: peptide chain release factor N(5)-glutamine methyltransferase [Acidimicrobiia bacterium]|nr:peptide chain release factor N(5)-glutamine methyltransferase [Acidimicrobiia bacterium]